MGSGRGGGVEVTQDDCTIILYVMVVKALSASVGVKGIAYWQHLGASPLLGRETKIQMSAQGRGERGLVNSEYTGHTKLY